LFDINSTIKKRWFGNMARIVGNGFFWWWWEKRRRGLADDGE